MAVAPAAGSYAALNPAPVYAACLAAVPSVVTHCHHPRPGAAAYGDEWEEVGNPIEGFRVPYELYTPYEIIRPVRYLVIAAVTSFYRHPLAAALENAG